MKKFVSAVLIFFVLCGIVTPVFAQAQLPRENEGTNIRTITSNGYTVAVTEMITENKQTVRTYNKQTLHTSDVSPAAVSTMTAEARGEQAEAILTALGMDEQYISDIPEDTLLESVDCEQIVATISHTKCDSEGNVTYLSEAEMQEAAATLSQKPEDTYEEKYGDEYMTVTHLVYYYGDGLYKFATNARWRTMPIWRRTDSIGSCAPILEIHDETRWGVVRYTEVLTDENLYMIYETECTDTITDMQNVHEGDWYGSAGLFDLPNNVSAIGGGKTYTDLRAYYEYEAHLRHPTLATNFNSVGTYAHMQAEIALDLSLSIDTGGVAAASVGIAVIPEERR